MSTSVVDKIEDLFSEKSKRAIVIEFDYDADNEIEHFYFPGSKNIPDMIDGSAFEFDADIFNIKSKRPIICHKTLVLNECNYIRIENIYFPSIIANECKIFIYKNGSDRVTDLEIPECTHVEIGNVLLHSECTFPSNCEQFILENCSLMGNSFTFRNLSTLIMKNIRGGSDSNIFCKNIKNLKITNSKFHSIFIFETKNSHIFYNELKYFFNDVYLDSIHHHDNIIEDDLRDGKMIKSLIELFVHE